ncbi:MAG: GNAT family N-acetyltransferase [Lachnospiraceae bacterium]|nr:GNAT family N-acetyltransferase [Lachnospiraceae bacterium]
MELIEITDDNWEYFKNLLYLESMPNGAEMLFAGAVEDGYPVAAIAMQKDDDVANIISVYTIEKYRRKGMGTRLIEACVQIADEFNATRIESDFSLSDPGVCELLKKNDFEIFEGDPILMVPISSLMKSSRVKKLLKYSDDSVKAKSLKNLNASEKRIMWDVLVDDVPSESEKKVSEDISNAIVDNSGVLHACLLASYYPDDKNVLIEWLGSYTDSQTDIPRVLKRFLATVIKDYPDVESISFCILNEKIYEFVKHMVDSEDEIKIEYKMAYAMRLM